MSDDTAQSDGTVDTSHGSSNRSDDGLSRRDLVAAGAVGWMTTSFAGCLDNDGGEGGEEDTVTVTNRTTTTEPVTQTTTETEPTDESETETEAGGTTTTTSCPESREFASDSPIGFLVGTYRSQTGDVLDDADVESVTVRFPDADIEPLELTWDGRHNEHVDDRWGGKLTNTDEIPNGEYQYEVVVTTDTDERNVMTGRFSISDPEE